MDVRWLNCLNGPERFFQPRRCSRQLRDRDGLDSAQHSRFVGPNRQPPTAVVFFCQRNDSSMFLRVLGLYIN